MTMNTAIQWTDHTWNPWHGCTKVSDGCDHCYMFAEKKQYGQDPEKVVRSKTKFREPLKWKEAARVFTCSWSDFFHIDADPWRDEAWEVIRATPHLQYQILTKRPGRMGHCLPSDWGDGYPNVWLGTSVENQYALHRVRQLKLVPARVHFLSCEPLLESIQPDLTGIDWVIIGGESGPGARPCDLGWIRKLVMRSSYAGVACFVKQLGTRPRVPNDDRHESWPGGEIPFADHYEPQYQGEPGPLHLKDRKGGDITEWPQYLRVREFPGMVPV